MEGRISIWGLGLTLSAMGVLLVACNAGQSDDSTVSVQGNWSGTYSAQGSDASTPVFALLQDGGSAYLFDSNGVVAVLPRFSGTQRTTGQVTVYPAKGYTFADGSSRKQLSMEATATGSQIAMDFSNDSDAAQDQGGDAQLLALETYSGQPSVRSGQWMGEYISPSPVALSLDVAADGSFTGSDAYGCSLTGRLDQLGAASTLFAVTLESRGPSPACGGAMTGLAHESDDDSFGFFRRSAGTYYYLCASNARGGFVAEFRVQ